MTRVIPPLTVAIVAAVLLVVVVGLDVSMNRSVSLDIEQDSGYYALASEPQHNRFEYRPMPSLTVNASDTVNFRITVDNGYPWGYDETYRFSVNGAEVASGRLTAAARDTGEVVIGVSGAKLLSGGPGQPKTAEGVSAFPQFQLVIGSHHLYASTSVTEESS